MLIAALLMVILIPLIAASVRVVPADCFGVVERLGRVMPEIRQPGLVLLRPFFELLILLPKEPFPVDLKLEAETWERIPLTYTVELTCEVRDPIKLHESLPGIQRGEVRAWRMERTVYRIKRFLDNTLLSEGRAAVRKGRLMECLSNREELEDEIQERLAWHAKKVGLEIASVSMKLLEVPDEAKWQVRQAAEAERAAREAADEAGEAQPPAEA